MADQEVTGFVERLQRFHEGLPEEQRPMLEAILEAARDGADTGGYMMNPYGAEVMAREQGADRLREAERANTVRMAEAGGDGAAGQGRAGLFEWLGGWLPAVRAHGAPRESGGAVGGTA